MTVIRTNRPYGFAQSILALCIVVFLVHPRLASAANVALLIGVSDYDQSVGLPDLRGPSNDVALMQEVLAAHGFEITILADGETDGIIPTGTAMLGALDDLVERVGQGDLVYLHFSGLGAQQGALGGGGMDAVLLPTDTARADAGSSVIPNALPVKVFAKSIAAMRAKGADVWFVLDSCHSTSALKVTSDRVAARCVDPSVLGIDAVVRAKGSLSFPDTGFEDLPGGSVIFFGSGTGELAREVQLDGADPSSWYGLFTSRIAARLQRAPGGSYRALFERVVDGLGDDILPGAARLQVPQWQGNLMGAPVFGLANDSAIRQFPVHEDQLHAGMLHGLRDHTIVALVADASAGKDEFLGYAQLHQTQTLNARLFGVTGPCMPRVEAPCSGIGPVPEGAAFARVVAGPINKSVRIVPPVDLTTGDTLEAAHPLHAELAQAVMGASAEGAMALRLDPNAIILSGAYDGALWFGEKLSFGATPMGLRWAPEDGPIEFVLRRIAQAERVVEALSTVSGLGSSLLQSPVELEIVQRPAHGRADCAPVQQNAAVQSDLTALAYVNQCDVLEFKLQSATSSPMLDINRIYIDSQYCVSVSYQRVKNAATAVTIGDPVSFNAEAKGAGAERMFFVISEAAPGAVSLNLEGVLDTCRREGNAIATGLDRDPVSDFLDALAERDVTQGGLERIGVSQLWVEAARWQVLPPAEVMRRSD